VREPVRGACGRLSGAFQLAFRGPERHRSGYYVSE
jgi:hypothetical protein